MGSFNNIYYLRSIKEMPEPCPIKRVRRMQSLVRSLKVHCVLVRQYHPLYLVHFLNNIFSEIFRDWGEKYVARNSGCGHKQVSQEIRHRFLFT